MITRKTIFTLLVFTAFMLMIALAALSSVYTSRRPVIRGLNPPAASPEEVLCIQGEGFGDGRKNGDVIIAGIRLTASHYLDWNDSEIRIKVPYEIDSGRVYVITDKGRSNGVLFANKSNIPVILSGPVKPGYPYIETVSPEKGVIGQKVVIKGMNFGRRRGDGKVFFHFLATDNTAASKTDTATLQGEIACSEIDFDYELWNDQELVIYVPDGAVSGSISVQNDRGKSNSIYFEVMNPVGTKRFESKKGYQIQQDVLISNVKSPEGEQAVEMWVPKIFDGYVQRNMEAIHDPEPLWDDFHGVMRYSIKPPKDWIEYSLSHTYWFDRYSIHTDINPSVVQSSYDNNRKLFSYYTSPGMYIPSDDEQIAAVAESLTGRTRNPYWKARAIYDYLINRLEYDPAFQYQELSEALDERRADARDYGLLFTAMARSAGIPARPVSGFIVHGDKLTRKHVWAEFFIPGFGWIPVDPALADGAGIYDIQVEDPVSFYFGNLENQHICFSRQVVQIPKVNPLSKTVVRKDLYSLQTSSEEYPPALEGYVTKWPDIRIVDWW